MTTTTHLVTGPEFALIGIIATVAAAVAWVGLFKLINWLAEK